MEKGSVKGSVKGVKVVSRFMRKNICRPRLNEISRQ